MATAYWPSQFATAYKFPASRGSGTVALLELTGFTSDSGDTSCYNPNDVVTAANNAGIPWIGRIVDVSTDGGVSNNSFNKAGSTGSSDTEAGLDVQVVALTAPAVTIGVYWAPNTQQGIVNACLYVASDHVNNPHVYSISYVSLEDFWSAAEANALNTALQDCAAVGVTTSAATGDYGAVAWGYQSAPINYNQCYVPYPAASPWVVAVGGTTVTLDASGNIIGEIVWNLTSGSPGNTQNYVTGGGVSHSNPVPSWQGAYNPLNYNTGVAGRGIPDLVLPGDVQYKIYSLFASSRLGSIGNLVIGGTSAGSPLFAGLMARMNALQGSPFGYINPYIYQMPHDGSIWGNINTGNNKLGSSVVGYDASAVIHWSPVTGLGSPANAQNFAVALTTLVANEILQASVSLKGAGSVSAGFITRGATNVTLQGTASVTVNALLREAAASVIAGQGSIKTLALGQLHTAITFSGLGLIVTFALPPPEPVLPSSSQHPIQLPTWSNEDFQNALLAKLPRGPVWPRDLDAVQAQVFSGLAPTYQRQADRAANLLLDAFPPTSVELLTEWEKSLGLPDECTPLAPTIQQRQATVKAKLISLGGQSVGIYVLMAKALGLNVTITEFGPPTPYTWQINEPLQQTTFFLAGANVAGDPLALYGSSEFECRVTKLAPAHTQVIFNYSGG